LNFETGFNDILIVWQTTSSCEILHRWTYVSLLTRRIHLD
jgi:hypothetical protein